MSVRAPVNNTGSDIARPDSDKLQRVALLIVDEVGYIPFDPQAANLMFMLVSRRYEHASRIVTSNKPFSGWGEIFGDEVTATAIIDRLVHHAEILSPQARLLPPEGPRPRTPTPSTQPDLTLHRAATRDARRSGSPYGLASAAHIGKVSRPSKGVNFRPALTLTLPEIRHQAAALERARPEL